MSEQQFQKEVMDELAMQEYQMDAIAEAKTRDTEENGYFYTENQE